MIVNLWIPLFLSLSPAPGSDPSAAGAPVQALLGALPTGSHGVLYCESLPRLREGAAQNTWYRLGRSDAGDLWRELAHDALREGPAEVGRLGELVRTTWDRLPGGALFFAGPEGGGLALATAGLEGELDELLALVLAEARSEGVRTELQHQGFTLECLAPPGAAWVVPAEDGAPAPEGREALAPGGAAQAGPALVVARGAGHLLAFAGPAAGSTLALARASIDGLATGRGEGAARFLAARAATGAGGLEFFLDFSNMMEAARARLEGARDVLDVDPVTLLGLEGETWLFGSITPYPGDRVEARGRLAVPPGGLAARVLRTLAPLPSDLLARIPAGAWNLGALGWNVGAFLDLVGEAVAQARPEGPTLENALEAAKAALGVDVRRDLVDTLSGLFLTYGTARPSSDPAQSLENLLDSVFVLGLTDGARFQDALESLLDVAGVLDGLESEEVEGCDTYRVSSQMAEDLGVRAGLAFSPRALVFSPRHTLLAPALSALAGAEGAATLTSDPRWAGLQNLALGAVAFGALELSFLEPMLVPGGLPEGLGREGEVAPDPFGRLLVWSIRPSSAGLDYWLGTR